MFKKALSIAASAALALSSLATPLLGVSAAEQGVVQDFLAGDVNMDGKVTAADYTALYQYLSNPEKYMLSEGALNNADCNGDGAVNVCDYKLVQAMTTGSQGGTDAEWEASRFGELSMEQCVALPGDTVTLYVSYDTLGEVPVECMSFNIVPEDPALKIINVKPATVSYYDERRDQYIDINVMNFSGSIGEEGNVYCLCDQMNNNLGKDFAKITVQVPDDCDPGVYGFKFVDAAASNKYGQSSDCSEMAIVGGAVIVEAIEETTTAPTEPETTTTQTTTMTEQTTTTAVSTVAALVTFEPAELEVGDDITLTAPLYNSDTLEISDIKVSGECFELVDVQLVKNAYQDYSAKIMVRAAHPGSGQFLVYVNGYRDGRQWVVYVCKGSVTVNGDEEWTTAPPTTTTTDQTTMTTQTTITTVNAERAWITLAPREMAVGETYTYAAPLYDSDIVELTDDIRFDSERLEIVDIKIVQKGERDFRANISVKAIAPGYAEFHVYVNGYKNTVPYAKYDCNGFITVLGEETTTTYAATTTEVTTTVSDRVIPVVPADPDVNRGDVDGNGQINASDASYILSYCVGRRDKAIDLAAADANEDGKINPSDAVDVLICYTKTSTIEPGRETEMNTVRDLDPSSKNYEWARTYLLNDVGSTYDENAMHVALGNYVGTPAENADGEKYIDFKLPVTLKRFDRIKAGQRADFISLDFTVPEGVTVKRIERDELTHVGTPAYYHDKDTNTLSVCIASDDEMINAYTLSKSDKLFTIIGTMDCDSAEKIVEYDGISYKCSEFKCTGGSYGNVYDSRTEVVSKNEKYQGLVGFDETQEPVTTATTTTITTATTTTVAVIEDPETTMTTIAVPEPKVNICIRKVDRNNNFVSGAVLQLTGVDMYGNPIMFNSNRYLLDSGVEMISGEGDNLVWRTGGDTGVFLILESGTYTLREVAAPMGYIPANDIVFNVRGDIVTDEYGRTIGGINMLDEYEPTTTTTILETTTTAEDTSSTAVTDTVTYIEEEWRTLIPAYIEIGETYTITTVVSEIDDIEFANNESISGECFELVDKNIVRLGSDSFRVSFVVKGTAVGRGSFDVYANAFKDGKFCKAFDFYCGVTVSEPEPVATTTDVTTSTTEMTTTGTDTTSELPDTDTTTETDTDTTTAPDTTTETDTTTEVPDTTTETDTDTTTAPDTTTETDTSTEVPGSSTEETTTETDTDTTTESETTTEPEEGELPETGYSKWYGIAETAVALMLAAGVCVVLRKKDE